MFLRLVVKYINANVDIQCAETWKHTPSPQMLVSRHCISEQIIQHLVIVTNDNAVHTNAGYMRV